MPAAPIAEPSPGDEITLSASEFKARCLELMDKVRSGELHRVTVTKRNTPFVQVVAVAAEAKAMSFFGSMRGRAPWWRGDPRDLDPTDEELCAMYGVNSVDELVSR